MKRGKATPKSDVNDDSMTSKSLMIGKDTNRHYYAGRWRDGEETQKVDIVHSRDGTEMGHQENDSNWPKLNGKADVVCGHEGTEMTTAWHRKASWLARTQTDVM